MATVKNTEKKLKDYKATLFIMGRTYTGKGDTVAKAVIDIRPEITRGRAVLTVEKGENSRERILMPKVVYRIYNGSDISRSLAMKNISLLFENI